MNIKIINTFEQAKKYLAEAKNNGDNLTDLWQEFMTRPFWAEIAQWAPFDISDMKPSPVCDLIALEEQINLLSKVLIDDLLAKFMEITKALPVEDDDAMVVAIYPLCNSNKIVKVRQNGVLGANAFGNMILSVNPLADNWQSWIPYVFAHEYHHKVWGHYWYVMREGNGIDGTFLEYLINEGQADLFAMRLHPELEPEWNRGFDEETEVKLWAKIEPILYSTDRDIHAKYMFGSEELDLPWCMGYSFGRMIVEDFMLQNPEITFSELITIRASEIFEASRFYNKGLHHHVAGGEIK